jgi:hypothetical protein
VTVYEQRYAGVCGNGHANTQFLDRPVSRAQVV